MIIADAIAEFKRLHGGVDPTEVVVTRIATVIIAAQQSLPAIYDGIPVRIGELPKLVKTGKGKRVVLAVSDLLGGRVGVVALEANA